MNECEELGGVADDQMELGAIHPSLSSLPGVSSDIQSNLPT